MRKYEQNGLDVEILESSSARGHLIDRKYANQCVKHGGDTPCGLPFLPTKPDFRALRLSKARSVQ